MDERPKVAVVIVAAGRGERVGAPDQGPKQYRPIAGRAILAHTIDAFAAHPAIDDIVVVIHPDDAELLTAIGIGQTHLRTVHGGATRQASTLRGLEALGEKTRIALIHDGVRPFVGSDMIDRVVAAIEPGCGALPVMPISDTLKRGDAGKVLATVDRHGLFAAQTPQGFAFAAILAAHRKAAASGRGDFTDDASIAEWAGMSVRLVEGAADNLKITWAKDIAMAEQRLTDARRFPDVRTGNGYDVHAFGEGDLVTLCGVAIPFGRGLSGHSDADVGLHALTDALLATCGAGDIGTHFPPSDPQWKGAASRLFVEHATRLVRGHGGRIAHADVTLICEAPKVGPHRDAMVAAMADMLGVAPGRVSVKATTNERLGFVGREEGIAAIATATVIYPGEVEL